MVERVLPDSVSFLMLSIFFCETKSLKDLDLTKQARLAIPGICLSPNMPPHPDI